MTTEEREELARLYLAYRVAWGARERYRKKYQKAESRLAEVSIKLWAWEAKLRLNS